MPAYAKGTAAMEEGAEKDTGSWNSVTTQPPACVWRVGLGRGTEALTVVLADALITALTVTEADAVTLDDAETLPVGELVKPGDGVADAEGEGEGDDVTEDVELLLCVAVLDAVGDACTKHRLAQMMRHAARNKRPPVGPARRREESCCISAR